MITDERRAEIVRRLRDRMPMQGCPMCKADSTTFVRCGRGTCAWDTLLMQEAADIVEAGTDADFNRGLHEAKIACMGLIIGTNPNDAQADRWYDQAIERCVSAIAKLEVK